MRGRVEQDVPIRLYRFRAQTRWRWAAGLPSTSGAVEGYGATPDEALRSLVKSITTDDLATLLAAAEGGAQ